MAKERYPEGHFIGQGMAFGIAFGGGIGVPLGIAIGNPAFFGLGLPIGLSIGSAIGYSFEKKAKAEGKIRPLTKEEKRKQKINGYIGLGFGIVVAITLLTVLLIR